MNQITYLSQISLLKGDMEEDLIDIRVFLPIMNYALTIETKKNSKISDLENIIKKTLAHIKFKSLRFVYKNMSIPPTHSLSELRITKNMDEQDCITVFVELFGA